MGDRLGAEEIIARLDLKPLIPEGGWFRRIYYKRGEVSIIHYLLAGRDFSEFHVLPYPEQYLFLMGDPVELYTGDRERGAWEKTLLGTDLAGGEVPSHLVGENRVQGSRLVPGGEWALLSTVMNPPFEPEIYRTCTPEELRRDFPGSGELIKTLTK